MVAILWGLEITIDDWGLFITACCHGSGRKLNEERIDWWIISLLDSFCVGHQFTVMIEDSSRRRRRNRRTIVYYGSLTPRLLLFRFLRKEPLLFIFGHFTFAPKNHCPSFSKDHHEGVNDEVDASERHDPVADLITRLGFNELLGEAEQEVDRGEDGVLIDDLRVVVNFLLEGPNVDKDEDPNEVEE